MFENTVNRMMPSGKGSALFGSIIIKVPWLCVMKRKVFIRDTVRYYSEDDKYRCNDNSMKYKDIDSVTPPSKYRVPYSERDEFWYSKFSLLVIKEVGLHDCTGMIQNTSSYQLSKTGLQIWVMRL